jgi:hypothetical protein
MLVCKEAMRVSVVDRLLGPSRILTRSGTGKTAVNLLHVSNAASNAAWICSVDSEME